MRRGRRTPCRERDAPRAGGRLLVVADPGHESTGWRAPRRGDPATVRRVVRRRTPRRDRARSTRRLMRGTRRACAPAVLRRHRLLRRATRTGSRRSRTLLAPRGVHRHRARAGRAIGRPVAVDVGRVHYDLDPLGRARPGTIAADGYALDPRRRRAPGRRPGGGDRRGRADGLHARRPRRSTCGLAGHLADRHGHRRRAAGPPRRRSPGRSRRSAAWRRRSSNSPDRAARAGLQLRRA